MRKSLPSRSNRVMRRDRNGDEHVAGLAAGHREPLPLQPDLLAVGEAGRDLDLELLAGRQLDAACRALGRFLERDRRGRGDVAARRLRDSSSSNWKPPPPRRARAAPPSPPNMSRSTSSKPPPPAPPPRPPRARCMPSGPQVKVSNAPSWPPNGPPAPPRWPAPSKPWKRGLPSASISPRSNALRLSSSPTIS